MSNLFINPGEFEVLKQGIYLSNNDCNVSLKNIKDSCVDCIITDPPYFLDNFDNKWNTDRITSRTKLSKAMPSLPAGSKFDRKQGEDLERFMTPVSEEMFRILKPGGFLLSFSQGRLYHRMAIAAENAGFEIRDMYIWYRDNQTKARAFSQDHFIKKMDISEEEKERIIKELGGRKTPQLRSTSEAIVMAQKPKEGTYVDNWLKYKTGLIDVSFSLDGSFPGTVMKVDKPTYIERNGCGHPTMKPVKLLEHLINIFTVKGAVVCDPFMGSGSAGVACCCTGRNFIGIEINKDYYDYAKERICKETG